MKGQSILMSHTLITGFSVIFVFVVATTFINMSNQFQGFILDKEMQQVCNVIRGAVENVYTQSDYRPPQQGVYGKISVRIPDKIAGLVYTARFVNKTLAVETIKKSYYCKVGFPSDYYGSSTGGLTDITLVRNATADRIEMKNI